MFMKLLSLLIFLTLGVNAFSADTSFVTDKLKLGKPTTGNDKVLEFDIGSGALNPKIRYSISGGAFQFSEDGTSFDDFGSGGGGSGGFGGLDSLNLLIGLEHNRIYTPSLPYTFRESFSRPGLPVIMWLMENYTASSTSMTAVVNPKFFDTANKVFDGTTGWAVGDSSDAGSITTSATHKIGSNSLAWNKAGGTDTVSLIAKDYGLQTFVNNQKIYYFLNMPSVTQFASAGIRISDEATVDTNYREITSANDCAGSPVATGWNLMCFNTAAGNGTNVGTGWTKSQGIRTLGFEVNTSASGQTYTSILVDSVVAIDDNDSLYVQPGDELTIYDASNSESMKLDAASSVRGILTLDAGLTNSYSAGLATFIARTVPTQLGNNWLRMVDGLTGAINLTQQVRIKEVLDAAVAGKKFDISITESTPLFWYIDSVDSTVQIKVASSADYSAEMLIGDKYHVFSTNYVNGKKKYIYRALVLTLDVNSSFGGGLLTLHNSGTNAGVAVGDLVVKDSVDTAVSCVTLSSEESFASISGHKSLKVEDLGIPYPGEGYVYGHWALGGSNGLVNLKGAGADLSENGGPTNRSVDFFGLFGAGPWATAADRFYLALATASELIFDSAISTGMNSFSFWYQSLSVGTAEALLAHATTNIAGNSWVLNKAASGDLVLRASGSSDLVTIPVASVPTGSWHHIALVVDDGVESRGYVDGVKVTGAVPAHGGDAPNSMFTIGDARSNNPSATSYMADLIAWAGYKLTDQDDSALYNGGVPVNVGEKPYIIHGFESAALSGQKLTVKGSIHRRTDAVSPIISGVAAAQQ